MDKQGFLFQAFLKKYNLMHFERQNENATKTFQNA